MAPVWEANHVWLIFVLTVFWTAYPAALGSIASTLGVPLFIAAIGIIFRGAAYALRSGTSSPRELSAIDTIFSISSILTPFALGAAAGAIASDRVPVGNAAGHLFSSWLNATSILVGALAVSASAYLAAVYLAADAARLGDPELERGFRVRALGAGVLAGAIALAGLAVLHEDAYSLFHGLVTGDGLSAVIVSILAGVATLALVFVRRYEAARYSAALAVAALVAGWALARWPVILPGLTVQQAAAAHDTLVSLVVAVLVGGAILFPALGLLFRLSLTGRFERAEGESGCSTWPTRAGRTPWASSACSASSSPRSRRSWCPRRPGFEGENFLCSLQIYAGERRGKPASRRRLILPSASTVDDAGGRRHAEPGKGERGTHPAGGRVAISRGDHEAAEQRAKRVGDVQGGVVERSRE
jgi:cytochrome d ubiquinol oxidase subunit II